MKGRNDGPGRANTRQGNSGPLKGHCPKGEVSDTKDEIVTEVDSKGRVINPEDGHSMLLRNVGKVDQTTRRHTKQAVTIEIPVRVLAWAAIVLTEMFHSFPQSLQSKEPG